MSFFGIQLVPLVADVLLFLLVVSAVVLARLAGRREYYRLAWQQIRRRRLPMACAGIMLLYLLVAVVDSVHFRQRLHDEGVPAVDDTGAAVYAPEVISLLDWLCAGLRERQEKTFSAPFATHQFTKELLEEEGGTLRRGFPRLLHGGAHLEDPAQRGGDIITVAAGGLGVGLLLSLATAVALVGWARYRRSAAGAANAGGVALFVGVVVVLTATLAALAAKYHVFGTDQVGTDVLYRALKGCRVGLILGTLTTLIATPLAILLGIAAGYLGGWVDDAVQYAYTTLTSIPDILKIAAAMLIVQTLTADAQTIHAADYRLVWLCVVMGIGSWTGLCRLIRGETLKVRENEYVQAADSLGVGRLTTMMRHILPNVTHIVLISVLLRFSGLVLAEAVLAYVGIGAHPSMDSWGNMINGARLDISRDPIVWWNLMAAFVFMFGLVLPANLFGDAVRDALDPRLKGTGGDFDTAAAEAA